MTLKKYFSLIPLFSLCYLFFWQVGFVAVFFLRGDSITWDLYLDYLPFMYTPGFIIPSTIKAFAVSATIISLIIYIFKNKKTA